MPGNGIAEHFLTECLFKVQKYKVSMINLFSIYMRKKSAGWMYEIHNCQFIIYIYIYIYTHITYGVQCINTKNNPRVRYLHAADDFNHLGCWLVQACWSGAIVTTITTILVCCKCKRQRRWLDIAITNMNAGTV